MGRYASRNAKKADLLKAKSDVETWRKAVEKLKPGTMAGDSVARKLKQAQDLVLSLQDGNY